jgi:two-component system, OmpR family, response regulator
MKTKILLVEDDANLGTILSEYLDTKGFETTLCRHGEEGLEAFLKGSYDLCILDIMMPKKDGFTLARDIRHRNKDIPIIFLTAKSMKEDALEGFRIGADDFVTKPFSMEVLLMRIQAVLRRTQKARSSGDIFTIGEYEFDYKRNLLKRRGIEQKLTTRESELLRLLCITEDVLDRNYALKTLWGDDSYFNSRSMDVFITKLRKYFKDDPSVEIINVHGQGFRLLLNKETGKEKSEKK